MSQATMRIGTFTTPITPPLGTPLQGLISRAEPALGVMDDLYLKVMLLDSGGTRFVLVTCDVIEFSPEFVELLRAEVERRFSIAPQNLMLCPSHTHTGPPTIRLGNLRPDPDYVSLLRKHVLGGIYACAQRLAEVRVSVGRGVCEEAGINRRTLTERGLRQHPNPSGPKDPEVQVVRFDRLDGRPIAAIVNFATHPTTLGVHVREVSADYPGRMRRLVEGAYGGELSVYFVQGAAGDVKAAVFGADGNFREGNEEDIDRLGRILGGEVLKVLESCRALDRVDLWAERKSVPFAYRHLPAPAELERLVLFHRRELKRWSSLDAEALNALDWEERHINQAAMHRDMIEWAEEMLAASRAGTLADHAFGDLQALVIGGTVALVGVPGELFSEVGLRLKRESPFEYTAICAYGNATLGYLPSRAAIREGGYEVDDAYKLYGFPSCFHEETETMLCREIGSLLRKDPST